MKRRGIILFYALLLVSISSGLLLAKNLFYPSLFTLVGADPIVVQQVTINQEQKLQILFVANGNSRTFSGTFSSQDSPYFQNPFTISFLVSNQSCAYNIDYHGENIFEGSVDRCDASDSYGCEGCLGYQYRWCDRGSEGYGNLRSHGLSWGSVPRYQKGNINGQLIYPNYLVEIILKNEETGEEAHAFIDPQHSVADLGTYGTVSKEGGLVADAICGAQQNTAVLRSLQGGGWRATQVYPYYNEYSNVLSIYQGYPPSLSKNDALANLNAKYNALVASLQGDSGNQFVFYPNQNIIQPVIKVTIDPVSFFRINVPVEGRPSIVSAQTTPLTAFNLTYLLVRLKNIGTQADSFDVNLDCPNPVQMGGTNRISLQPDEEGELELTISGAAGTQICTLIARSANIPANEATSQVSLTINKNACPSDFDCCPENGVVYESKIPAPTTRWQQRSNDGNYSCGFYEFVYYSCSQNFQVVENHSEEIQGTDSCYALGQPTATPPAPTVTPEAPLCPEGTVYSNGFCEYVPSDRGCGEGAEFDAISGTCVLRIIPTVTPIVLPTSMAPTARPLVKKAGAVPVLPDWLLVGVFVFSGIGAYFVKVKKR